MNYKESMEGDHIPEFVNLEEYNNLLRELENLEEKDLHQAEINIKIKVPEVITETIKLIAGFFYQIPTNNYLQHCIFSNLIADIDILLSHHIGFEKLSKLINKINEDVCKKW